MMSSSPATACTGSCTSCSCCRRSPQSTNSRRASARRAGARRGCGHDELVGSRRRGRLLVAADWRAGRRKRAGSVLQPPGGNPAALLRHAAQGHRHSELADHAGDDIHHRGAAVDHQDRHRRAGGRAEPGHRRRAGGGDGAVPRQHRRSVCVELPLPDNAGAGEPRGAVLAAVTDFRAPSAAVDLVLRQERGGADHVARAERRKPAPGVPEPGHLQPGRHAEPLRDHPRDVPAGRAAGDHHADGGAGAHRHHAGVAAHRVGDVHAGATSHRGGEREPAGEHLRRSGGAGAEPRGNQHAPLRRGEQRPPGREPARKPTLGGADADGRDPDGGGNWARGGVRREHGDQRYVGGERHRCLRAVRAAVLRPDPEPDDAVHPVPAGDDVGGAHLRAAGHAGGGGGQAGRRRAADSAGRHCAGGRALPLRAERRGGARGDLRRQGGRDGGAGGARLGPGRRRWWRCSTASTT